MVDKFLNDQLLNILDGDWQELSELIQVVPEEVTSLLRYTGQFVIWHYVCMRSHIDDRWTPNCNRSLILVIRFNLREPPVGRLTPDA